MSSTSAPQVRREERDGQPSSFQAMEVSSPTHTASLTSVSASVDGVVGTDTSAGLSCDEAIEELGITSFHRLAACILGLGNAADAVELLAISYVLPELEISDAERGT